MKKSEFLSELKKYLYGLPEEEIKESLDYYAEIIDDRIEDGADEETAVDGVGKPWIIAGSVRSEKLKTEKGEKINDVPTRTPESCSSPQMDIASFTRWRILRVCSPFNFARYLRYALTVRSSSAGADSPSQPKCLL